MSVLNDKRCKNFFVQYEDNYLFRLTEYYDINKTKNILNNTKTKIDWGMV